MYKSMIKTPSPCFLKPYQGLEKCNSVLKKVLTKLQVFELDKYIEHHNLTQCRDMNKVQKVKHITRHRVFNNLTASSG